MNRYTKCISLASIYCALIVFSFCRQTKGKVLFSADEPLNGFECTGKDAVDGTGDLDAKSVAKCAQLCTGYSECGGFYYTSEGNRCRLCNLLFEPHGTASLSGSRYYRRNEYHEMSPGKTFRIFSEMGTCSEAQERCEETGGTLVKIRDEDEMKQISDTLTSSPGFNSMAEYWTDGTYDVPTLTWEFSDGTPMPMDPTTFWADGAPNPNLNEHCTRLDYTLDYSYRWNDMLCDAVRNFICEYS